MNSVCLPICPPVPALINVNILIYNWYMLVCFTMAFSVTKIWCVTFLVYLHSTHNNSVILWYMLKFVDSMTIGDNRRNKVLKRVMNFPDCVLGLHFNLQCFIMYTWRKIFFFIFIIYLVAFFKLEKAKCLFCLD